MNSSTSSSEATRSSVRFLVCLAVLVTVTEAAFGALFPVHLGRHEVDDCAYLVATARSPIRTVLLSDSVSYGVLRSLEIPDDLLDLTSNQAIGIAGNTFLVQRLFERLDDLGAAMPERIILAFNPASFESNLDSERFLDSYFASVFHRPNEIEDVQESLNRPDIVRLQRRDAFAHGFELPSYLRRGHLHRPLREGLRSLKRWLQRSSGTTREAPGGAAVWRETARRKIEERSKLRFQPSEVSEVYLPKLARLCDRRGVELLIVTAPVAPTILEAWRRSGFLDAYRAWLRAIAERFPALRILDPCPWVPASDALFYDGVHLTEEGKEGWGRALRLVSR